MDTRLKFFEQPELYIVEYYEDKRNQIDINCETLILETKDESEIQSLNELRQSMIEKLESVTKKVLERCKSLRSKLNSDNFEQIKNEIFSDQYCIILRVCMSLFDFKLGILLFTEFDDHLLNGFK